MNYNRIEFRLREVSMNRIVKGLLIVFIFVGLSVILISCSVKKVVEGNEVKEGLTASEVGSKDNESEHRLILSDAEKEYIDELRKNGPLKIASRVIESVYIVGEDGEATGFNYDLIKSFATYFDLELEVKNVEFDDYFSENSRVPDPDEIMNGYRYVPDLMNEVSIYVDTVTNLEWRAKIVSFIDILPVKQVIIHRSGESFESVETLAEKTVIVGENTSYAYRIKELEKELNIEIETIYDNSVTGQLQNFVDSEADVTISDSSIAVLELQSMPMLEMGIPISDVQFLGWCTSKDDVLLTSILRKYIRYIEETGEINVYWMTEFGITLSEYLSIINIETM